MATLPTGLPARLLAWTGGPVQRRLAQCALQLPAIDAFEATLKAESDSELQMRSRALRYRAKCGEPSNQLLPEAYALMREAARRTLGLRHYGVQLLGGIAMHQRAIVEMQTGEGKTLTATLPLYLAALAGRGAHLATVNDYLARRDADGMGPAFELLGLRVGVIQTQMAPSARRAAYACDVTYGTAKEFGFDFLRDRLLLRHRSAADNDLLARLLDSERAPLDVVQREPWFALVDEADSVLIDEARTPLIISAPPTDQQHAEKVLYEWASQAARRCGSNSNLYSTQLDRRNVELTGEGRRYVRSIPRFDGMESINMLSLYAAVERAIRAERFYIRDRHYVVRQDEIVIVDEFTGRLAEGRKWRDGLHQAIEAKEGVAITTATSHAARITVQDFFLRYTQLAGMTGTAANSASELRRVYGLCVVPIPTNRPPIRRQMPTQACRSFAEKVTAIVAETRALHQTGRPVLIGTRSIDKSESISQALDAAGIAHQVLNAREEEREAEIVAEAGQAGRVTVATNMAGRGTDIRLGESVAELGGLHVICTEMHESARIDRQLIGRCGRQGDPGSFRQYLALDDDLLLVGLGAGAAARWQRRMERSRVINASRAFRRAQRSIERRHARERRSLLFYERQRQRMQDQMGLDPYLDSPA